MQESHMDYIEIDMNTYKRKKHFEYFRTLAYPYVGVTVNVNITPFIKEVKRLRLPFFLSFCYCVSKAANAVLEFRQRIMRDTIIQFKNCPISYTVALEDETYCYCTLNQNKDIPLIEYLPYALRVQENAKNRRNVEDGENALSLLFVSTLPWISYSSIIQPVPIPADSNPRITWGRYFEQGKEQIIPVSVLCHHALVDGLHIAQFYKKLDDELRESEKVLKKIPSFEQ